MGIIRTFKTRTPAPTAVLLSNSTLESEADVGTVVGDLTISPVDAVAADFDIVYDPSTKFFTEGPTLKTTGLVTAGSYPIIVRVWDRHGSYRDQPFTIVVDASVDTVPAVFTSASTKSRAENLVATHILTTDKPCTFTLVGGADQAKFSISGNTLTLPAKNFEAPDDADTNNTYVVTVRATTITSITTDQTITFTITDVAESGSVPRPDGLNYAPPGYGTPFVYATDAPAAGSRILWSAGGYANTAAGFTAACDAARAASKSLVLDTVQTYYAVSLNTMPIGLYGAPGVIIEYKTNSTTAAASIGSATPCLGYVTDRDLTCRGIQFKNFGTVFGFATRSLLRAQVGTPAGPGGVPPKSADYQAAWGGSWELWGESSGYGAARAIERSSAGWTAQRNGVGIPVNYVTYPPGAAGSPGNIGPSITISDCVFTNCQNVFLAASDTLILGPFNFHRNKLNGTYGGFDIATSCWGEIYATANEHYNCTLANNRQIPTTIQSHRFHTFIKIGVDKGIDVPVHPGGNGSVWQTCIIENNYQHDIEDVGNADTVNAACGMDVRGGTPTTVTGTDPLTCTSSISISFNRFVRVRGLKGQEDCNNIYTKIRGGVIEGNYSEDCGAVDGRIFKTVTWTSGSATGTGLANVTGLAAGMETSRLPPSLNKATKVQTVGSTSYTLSYQATATGSGTVGFGSDGSETNGILCKGGYYYTSFAGTLSIRGNEFVNMPSFATLGYLGEANCSVIKSHEMGTVIVNIIGNIIRNTNATEPIGVTHGLIRIYASSKDVNMWDNQFHNCNITGSSGLIMFHAWTPISGSQHEVSNNEATYGAAVSYTASSQKIRSTSGWSSGSVKVGSGAAANVLHGSGGDFTMQAPSGTSATAERIYVRPTVTL